MAKANAVLMWENVQSRSRETKTTLITRTLHQLSKNTSHMTSRKSKKNGGWPQGPVAAATAAVAAAVVVMVVVKGTRE